jgi:hypothetical protein
MYVKRKNELRNGDVFKWQRPDFGARPLGRFNPRNFRGVKRAEARAPSPDYSTVF